MIPVPRNTSAANSQPLYQEDTPTDAYRFGRELFGLFLLFWSLLLLLSLFTFDANDPSLNHVVSGKAEIQNRAGLFGAYAAGFLNDVFGVAAFLWPLAFGALGAAYVSSSYAMHWWRWCGFFLLTLCLLVLSASLDMSLGDLKGGGMVGDALYGNSSRYLSPGGSGLVWFFIFLVGIQLVCNISWFSLMARAWDRMPGKGGNSEPAAESAQGEGRAASSITQVETADSASDQPEDANKALPTGSFIQRCKVWMGKCLPRSADSFDISTSEATALPVTLAKAAATPSPLSATTKRVEEWDDEPFAQSEDLESPLAAAPAVHAVEQPLSNVVSPSVKAAQAAPSPKAAPSPAPAPSDTKVDQSAESPPPTAPGKKAAVPLPPLDLLIPPVKADKGGKNSQNDDVTARAEALMACLSDFNIPGELMRVTPGPVVTMYEVLPAKGIRVNRIVNLDNDLARALKAVAIRIQAPIPGSDTVGIEIPNIRREMVNFRELAATESFGKSRDPLPMILGKTITGKPFMADLTTMPHMLVAGATGAGKSVCLNGILISLLYRVQPDNLRLLLIDPKRIELAVYADVPHLVHPVVTEMSEAKNALDWAVHEMDRRYDAMARLGVRDVSSYNKKLAAFKKELPPDFADLEHMPYLVIVIDELADLMMTAAREVETYIVRLAQLARAAGIHMILATQRPSVDVVTGLIKANFPCRISFQVSSAYDSKTILDQKGAEQLLGRGDMLFKDRSGRLQRLHGPFLSDDEVQAVVAHWKHYLRPSYKVDFGQWGTDGATGQTSGTPDAESDPLYTEVLAFVQEQGRASISLVQRRFKIGFNRAARLVEQLEQDGVIGPADGSKPRKVVS